VFVMGNMKFDVKPGMLDRNPSEIKTSFNIPLGQKVWVTGSTHPGEERHLMAVFTRLRSIYSNFSLIIAPRHIERAKSILSLAKEFNFKAACLSTSGSTDGEINVWVVDEMGVLNHLYSFADIVFMGGSLVEHGGQNPIEPALFKKSVLVGPFTSNFTQVYNELEEANAVRRVVSEDELFVNAKELMAQDELRENMGLRACEKVLSLGGATKKTVVMIQKFLPKGNLRQSSLETTESLESRETCPTS